MHKPPSKLKDFSSLIKITETLCSPTGCPWDQEQTHESLVPFAIEEVHEFAEAVESKDFDHMKEELGDLLLQVTLHAEKAKLGGKFTIEDVIETLNQKMIRRHPHVFAQIKVKNSKEVLINWSQIKEQEKKSAQRSLQERPKFDVPIQLPSLQRAAKIGAKTKKHNFDWPNVMGVLDKVEEEIKELRVELKSRSRRSRIKQMDELGDVLFSLSQLARHLEIDPEQALRKSNLKFERRFFKMKSQVEKTKKNLTDLTPKELESAWQRAKKTLKKS